MRVDGPSRTAAMLEARPGCCAICDRPRDWDGRKRSRTCGRPYCLAEWSKLSQRDVQRKRRPELRSLARVRAELERSMAKLVRRIEEAAR